MKYFQTALAATILLAAAHHPLHAQQRSFAINPDSETVSVQIAETPATVVRNVTAVQRVPPAPASQAGADKVHPPAAQALMALGIALIVTPSMFGGAFSN